MERKKRVKKLVGFKHLADFSKYKCMEEVTQKASNSFRIFLEFAAQDPLHKKPMNSSSKSTEFRGWASAAMKNIS